MTEKTVNLRGLKCPLPALRTKKVLKGMTAGEVILVECTDPLAAIDIPNLVNQTGDVLEATNRADDVLTFRIRKA
ncbi:MAG: sulfurtransferase TusA family protein [Pseudorhodoplanes sp.]|uniref:sulfurtransferase TusA family protein n=1 Tax=Pseudorhodoplanes sp. TaxID=1934341 RepID=UPI003D0F3946